MLQAGRSGLWAFSPWKLLAEIPRTLAVTLVMARLLTMLGRQRQEKHREARTLVVVWLSSTHVAGAVTWEQTRWQVAAIHSGDWLLKTVLIADIACGDQGGWHEHNESAQTKAHVR